MADFLQVHLNVSRIYNNLCGWLCCLAFTVKSLLELDTSEASKPNCFIASFSSP